MEETDIATAGESEVGYGFVETDGCDFIEEPLYITPNKDECHNHPAL